MKPYADIADRFARNLIASAFDAAHQLLAQSLREQTSPAKLEAELKSMIEYGNGPITHVEVMNTLEEWPAKQENDVGWVYVAMSGDHWSEAVSVIVSNEDSKLAIRDIEWGRP